jgi:hypothetical protein
MKQRLVVLSTTFFLLWGLLHVAGGAAMLLAAGDPVAYQATLSTAQPANATLVPPPGSPSLSVLPFHAWNILWLGLCVSVIALTLNRRNSPSGYWINLALISGADLGLVLFLVLPGVMAPTTASPGLLLWIPAAIFGFLALRPVVAPR